MFLLESVPPDMSHMYYMCSSNFTKTLKTTPKKVKDGALNTNLLKMSFLGVKYGFFYISQTYVVWMSIL